MAKVADDMPRVATDIVAGRRQRAELATEIKRLARSRRIEVRSMLARAKTSRINVARELAATIDDVTKARHREIKSLLAGMKTSRTSAGRKHREEAVATIRLRGDEIRLLLASCRRAMTARRQHRVERERAQRAAAAEFMRDLTNRVATMLGEFAKDDRHRAAAVRERLAGYARERRAAVVAWRGILTPRARGYQGSSQGLGEGGTA
ncbi:hypothetical protein [Bradyrhizobium liaoningense]